MSNFPDLLNIDQDGGGENFWPSLTDIMMVVVMIFLISTATLIIKNWSLVRDLTATIEAERAARQKIQLTTAENMTLEERIAALEGMVSSLQLKEMKTREEKTALEARVEQLVSDLARSDRTVAALESQLTEKKRQIEMQLEQQRRLDNELETLKARMAGQAQTLETTRAQLEAREASLAEKQQALEEANRVITALRLKHENQQNALEASRQSIALTEENLARLRKEFAELEAKYNKLVRPARTTKGKVIVAARLQKIDGENHYAIRMPDANGFEAVDEATLHEKLAALKKKFGDKLYMRIIFPDDNGLSYREAYAFTNELLSKYDYYHAK